MRRSLKSFLSGTSGLAAVEFSLILPLLVTIVFGFVSLHSSISASKHTSIITATVTDLAGRYTFMNDERIDLLGATATALAANLPGDNEVSLAIAQVVKPACGDFDEAYVDWTASYNDAPPWTTEEVQSLPPSVIEDRASCAGHGLLYVRVSMTHSSGLFRTFGRTPVYTERLNTRSRVVFFTDFL